MKKIKINIPTEAQEQTSLFAWANYKPELRYLMWCNTNSGKWSPQYAVKLKRMGAKAGVPDITIAIPKKGYHGLYIELKRLKGGIISEVQDNMQTELFKQGYYVAVCNGWIEAKKIICEYMGWKDER